MSFGTTIPVTGLNLGAIGQVSRLGERVITSRPVFAGAGSTNINFGDTVVITPNATGGGDTYQTVAGFIAAGGIMAPSLFAGVANREVKTNLAYTSLGNSGTPQIAYYAPNELAEALERGSIVVKINNGTPKSQSAVFLRTVLNGGIPAGVVGGLEAVADAAVNTTAAALTTNSTTLTVASAVGIAVGQLITGIGIPSNTFVTVVAGTTLTLSQAATVANAAALNFASTIDLSAVGVIFRTGVLDANGCAEITLKQRVAA